MSEQREPDPDPLFEEWASGIEALREPVTDLVQKRAVWWTLQQVFLNNPTLPPSGLFDFLVINYVESASVGVRRLVDRDARTTSLMRLLQRMLDHPDLLTRERFIETREGNTPIDDFVSQRFDEFAGEPGHDHVPCDAIQRDIDRLIDASALVKQYVDKGIAHMDKTPPTQLPSFGSLHNAISEIEAVFRRWYGFLLARDISILPTTVQNWFAPLLVPWITDPKRTPTYGVQPPV